MTSKLPLRLKNIHLKDLGGELILYSSEQKAMHVLNPTAQLIWNLCDGEHSLAEMEQEIRARFSIPAERDIRADIESTLELFRQKGLLESKEDSG